MDILRGDTIRMGRNDKDNQFCTNYQFLGAARPKYNPMALEPLLSISHAKILSETVSKPGIGCIFWEEIRFAWVVMIGHEFDENCLKIDQQTVLGYFRRFLMDRKFSDTLYCWLLVELRRLILPVHREVLGTSLNRSKLDSKIPSVGQSIDYRYTFFEVHNNK